MRVPPVLPRVLGVLTCAYGGRVFARPETLARPVGLGAAMSSPRVRGTIRAMGIRDVASGAAMVLLPAGRPLQGAVAARVACDVSDMVGLGVASPGRRNKAKVLAVAGSWALMCGATWSAAGAIRSGEGTELRMMGPRATRRAARRRS